jgi:hypothetical protein
MGITILSQKSGTEDTMQYKRILLHLLERNPQMYEQMRRQRKMLPTLEYHARELKILHEAWMEILSQATPLSDETQIACEALELAIQDLQDRLSGGSPLNENQAISVDKAMAYVRDHMQPA